MLFSLGSYEPTDTTLRRLGRLRPGAPRVWHLDGYLGARHFTYGIYQAEPAYRDVRARVAEVLAAGDPGRGAISATDGCTGELTLSVDPAVPEFQLDAATTHEVVAAGASAERSPTRR